MATDITTSISGVAINNNRAICSTLPTGGTAKLLIRPNYPANLIIGNIENKYEDRFDDTTYYTVGSSGILGV